jgi:hypothetical protein
MTLHMAYVTGPRIRLGVGVEFERATGQTWDICHAKCRKCTERANR